MRQFLTIGLFQGAIYGLVAVGLVLVYKGSRVFNFAQGEFGTVAAYVTFGLWSLLGVPMWAAIIGGLAAGTLLGILVERLVIRPLFHASRITLLVATIGVGLFLLAAVSVVGRIEIRSVDPILTGQVVILGAVITYQQLIALGVLAVLAGALAWFFSRTNLGLAVLATSQDELATRIVGISVPGMSRFIWGFAALLGAIAGILQASIIFLTPGMMTRTALVPAFTAAVLGGMTSLPGAFLGGILVGVAQNLGIFYLGDTGVGLPGAGELVLFSMLLLALMIRPQGILGKEA